jgi:hypothetical protein
MTETPRPITHLNDEKKFKVYNYLQANKDRLLKELPSYRQEAEAISRELGFTVTETNLQTAAEVCGVTWKARKLGGASGVAGVLQFFKEEAARLDGEVARMVKEIETLEETIVTLDSRLGQVCGRLEQVEGENQRLRVMATEIGRTFDIKFPASAGVPPTNAKHVTVNNSK